METRSKTRAGQTQVQLEGVLEGLEQRPPIDIHDEDMGLATLLGDGEFPSVGVERTEVIATTSIPGDIAVVSEWVPARESVMEPSRPQPITPALVLAESAAAHIPTLVYASEHIPTKVLAKSNDPRIR